MQTSALLLITTTLNILQQTDDVFPFLEKGHKYGAAFLKNHGNCTRFSLNRKIQEHLTEIKYYLKRMVVSAYLFLKFLLLLFFSLYFINNVRKWTVVSMVSHGFVNSCVMKVSLIIVR